LPRLVPVVAERGLTVFRDQEFSADLVGTSTGRAVKRIEDVRVLRQVQFSEDAGPMAHPVRPDSFVEINNFYTVTIYEKGSEVVRMYYTLLGHDGFRKGMDLYFARHDGQAVECDDFRAAMADSSGRDLTQFERWYSQAGTPRLKAVTSYDPATQVYQISLSQSCAHAAVQDADLPAQLPFHIPVAVGLLDSSGHDLALHLEGAIESASVNNTDNKTLVLELTEASQTFRFTGVAAQPTPSLLRNFSAPVILEYDYTDEELAHLLAHDSDPFCRWEAGQRLAMRRLIKLTLALQNGSELSVDAMFIEALRSTLNDHSLDPSLRELVLTLPSEATIAEQFDVVDPHAIHAARQFMRTTLSQHLNADMQSAYENNLTPGPYSPDAVSAARRGLKNLALAYLLKIQMHLALHWQKLSLIMLRI